jgi:hypothetical protein
VVWQTVRKLAGFLTDAGLEALVAWATDELQRRSKQRYDNALTALDASLRELEGHINPEE